MGLLPLPGQVPADDAMSPQALTTLVAPVSADTFPGRSLAKTLSASGVSIIDLQTGQELFGRLSGQRRPVGSLTKVMTALLIAESHAMDEVVVVPRNIRSVGGSTADLPPGAHFTVGDLLSATLIASANDAAEALAQYDSGSSGAFVERMNERARSLGLRNTSFANPAGLDDDQQWSTPRDIAWLTAFALQHPEIRKRMSLPTAAIRSREGETLHLQNTHALLRHHSSVIAGKTGTTNAARQCLISVVQENGREYIVVLLGSRERYLDMRAVLRVLSSFFA